MSNHHFTTWVLQVELCATKYMVGRGSTSKNTNPPETTHHCHHPPKLNLNNNREVGRFKENGCSPGTLAEIQPCHQLMCDAYLPNVSHHSYWLWWEEQQESAHVEIWQPVSNGLCFVLLELQPIPKRGSVFRID